MYFSFFFFNDTATTEIYTLSLHDALPICKLRAFRGRHYPACCNRGPIRDGPAMNKKWKPGKRDRKSTRLNSSHSQISYAVFCLKKKKKKNDGNINSIRRGATHLSRSIVGT